MKVLIIGGGGLVGQKLGKALAARGHLRDTEITSLVLADVVDPAPIDAPFAVERKTCDIADRASVDSLIEADTDVIYLLAAIVSGQAEEEFDLGYAINMMGTLNVLERARALETKPVVVFTSSIAVYGGEVPDPIIDHTFLNPQTSYGAQKAIGELLLNDYSRKGYVDGRGFRLPTISVRPGKPNRAASSFMSSILREPLNGQEAICPVGEDFPHYYLSPRKCVENLIKGAEIPTEDLGMNRCMMMPGRTWTIRQLVDAMTAVAGPEAAKLIKWESQPEIERIVNGWRFDMRPEKSIALGLEADESFEDNIRYYLEDDKPKP
ncbi:D-erythronate dehydrogenase [Pseudoprimorskyibacter insulae]|uniref:Putative epimerase/dehydratase n=1 Tax=Pseudoprimorskyibacter insulae TaxID=1695997 RepID=A0A2R8APP6_9RHOB|nr:D-erythronate dehydrogenase [Pseudoprimorskyibacter insulae]SPF78003.1 putative epimerase/dehydratase [Pseudoprimorskyibacter insulae]